MYGYGAEMEIDAASGGWCGFHSPCPVRSHLDDLNVARCDNGMATPPFQSVKLSIGNGCTYIYAYQCTPESKIANAIHRAYLDSGGADLLRACTLVIPIQNLDSCLSTIPAIHFHTTRYTYFCRLRDWIPRFFSAVVV